MKLVSVLLAVTLLSTSFSSARTWTSADGNQIEAEFIEATETHVTIRRTSDGRRFTLELTRLSEADQSWVSEKLSGADESGVELPSHLAELVASSGSILFEDNFDREDPDDSESLGGSWATNSASRAQGEKQNDLVDGTLVMTISPKADHAISTRHECSEPYGDAVVALRVKLEEGESLKLAYNDRQHKAVHAGHINGVTMTPTKVTLADEREGRFLLKYRDAKGTPEGDAAMAAALEKHEKTFEAELETGEWHDVVTHHSGETLTVYYDGDEVASFTSPGFGHETKRDFVFAVPKRAVVDDLKIWKVTSSAE